jgi:hypothetical protein
MNDNRIRSTSIERTCFVITGDEAYHFVTWNCTKSACDSEKQTNQACPVRH